MPEINIYKSDKQYWHPLSTSTINFIKSLPAKIKPSQEERVILKCLQHMDEAIQFEMQQPLFNTVRLFIIFQAIFRAICNQHRELASAFAKEAGRLILTRFDALTTPLYSTSKPSHFDTERYSELPLEIEGQKKVTVERGDIVTALKDFWNIQIFEKYPEDFQFAKYGNYKNLKNLLYKNDNVHAEDFKAHPCQKINLGFEDYDIDIETDYLLLLCQFFDIAWPLAFFVPLVGWGYLAVRLYNNTDRLTNERYSLFSCGEETENDLEVEPLTWAREM